MGYYFKEKVLKKLSLIIKNQKTSMANDQAMLDLLIQADEQTNEIASDIADLVANATSLEEIKAKLTGHVAKLKTVASVHTPTVSPVPPVEPGG